MSGHSKWANIKRKKEAEDKKKGQAFSKIARAIVAAVKEGGSVDPGLNARLRITLQQARVANMPKDNVERALQRGEKQEEELEGFILEGYGPGGVAVMMKVLTDNRQRTVQEIKSFFQRYGGNLAEPGAVAFQFESEGMIRVAPLNEEEILNFVDLGATDFKQSESEVVFYFPTHLLEQFRGELEKRGAQILLVDQVMKPKSPIIINDEGMKAQVKNFLDFLEENEDIQRLFTNLNE